MARWNSSRLRSLVCTVWLVSVLGAFSQSTSSLKLADVRTRDPFILADEATRTYYLVSSVIRPAGAARKGVSVLTSRDLQAWEGPFSVFDMPEDFWGRDGWVWAPEIHFYRGKYYLFVTFMNNEKIGEQWPDWPPRVKRGTQILVADSPRGPFRPFRNRSHTSPDLMTLDGTLWVENGAPYMVYCHEWVQLRDGTIEAVRLKDDLSDVEGEAMVLFKGSDAPWAPKNKDRYVTDGPFLYRTRAGKLLMIWSSFADRSGYAVGLAVSESGRLEGPWRQTAEPLFKDDGGHGMLFRTFEGALMLLLHQPNRSPKERARLFEVEDLGDSIRIKHHR